jgi:hypothetical protein
MLVTAHWRAPKTSVWYLNTIFALWYTALCPWHRQARGHPIKWRAGVASAVQGREPSVTAHKQHVAFDHNIEDLHHMFVALMLMWPASTGQYPWDPHLS